MLYACGWSHLWLLVYVYTNHIFCLLCLLFSVLLYPPKEARRVGVPRAAVEFTHLPFI